ncbi:MAG: hypothetical protein RLZZ12_691 [Actinomycetota bacterium]|jgi:hypothetical protein
MFFNCFVGSGDIAFFLTPIRLRVLGTAFLGVVSPGTHREILAYFGQD